MEVIVKSLKYLDIRRNYLKEIPDIIKKGNNMTKMWISDNPYECNCDMLWMKDWLINATNVEDKDNVTCLHNEVKGERRVEHFLIS